MLSLPNLLRAPGGPSTGSAKGQGTGRVLVTLRRQQMGSIQGSPVPGAAQSCEEHASSSPFPGPCAQSHFYQLNHQIIQLGYRWVPRRWIIMFNGDLLTLTDPGNTTSCKVVFPSPLLFMDVVKGPTSSLLQERPLLQPAQSLH